MLQGVLGRVDRVVGAPEDGRKQVRAAGGEDEGQQREAEAAAIAAVATVQDVGSAAVVLLQVHAPPRRVARLLGDRVAKEDDLGPGVQGTLIEVKTGSHNLDCRAPYRKQAAAAEPGVDTIRSMGVRVSPATTLGAAEAASRRRASQARCRGGAQNKAGICKRQWQRR